MYAEVLRNTLDPAKIPPVEVVKELQAILARQPGYQGYLAIEGEGSQRTIVRMWTSAAAAQAAKDSAELIRFRETSVVPSLTLHEVIGCGEVLHMDIKQAEV